MKKRNIAFVGVVALLAGSLLSCGGSAPETDPSNYTEITIEEAEEIISNFDAQTALEDIETLVFNIEGTQLTSSEPEEAEVQYQFDFTDESLYMYVYGATESSKYETLIAGSGDSYKYQYANNGEVTTDLDLTFEQAKNQINNGYWSSLKTNVVFDEDFIYSMTQYGYETEVTYSTYGDYIMLKVSYEADGYTGDAYVVYNGQGLLRYGQTSISVTSSGRTYNLSAKYDAEYNVTFSRKSSL